MSRFIGCILGIVAGWYIADYIQDKVVEECENHVSFVVKGKTFQCSSVPKPVIEKAKIELENRI
jgi:hypothetical protein